MMQVQSQEYENEILFAKQKSMDFSIINYSKKVEELTRSYEELTAIIRIKETEMIEINNEIFSGRMQSDGMKKELAFRRERIEGLQQKLRHI
jgi:hypothetical protein